MKWQCTCASPCATADKSLRNWQQCRPQQEHFTKSGIIRVAAGPTRLLLPAQRRRISVAVHEAEGSAPSAFANSQLSECDSLKTQLIR